MLAALFAPLLDSAGIVEGEALAPYRAEQRGRYENKAVLLLRPRSTEEVAAIVRTAQAHGIALVPQGGNTGLVGGTVALNDRQVLLNLERMNRLRAVEADNFTLTAEAGCTLQQVKDAAAAVGLHYPLGLSVADKAQIGGTIATNAGGLNALKYGTARALVLGIEAVLPDGTIVSELTAVRKNNQGLDVKQLFIGSEGSVGIITAATLQLFPAYAEQATVAVFASTAADAMTAFRTARKASDERLIAAELIAGDALRLVQTCRPALPFPYPLAAPWLLLLRLASHRHGGLAMVPEQVADSIEAAAPVEVYAALREEEEHLWAYRRELPWVQREAGASLKHDIALPLHHIAPFLESTGPKVLSLVPGATLIPFGHVGDGNLHYNIQQPPGAAAEEFLARREAVAAVVLENTARHGGTFSAEHGIGLAKQAALCQYGDPGALAVRRRIKHALDPAGGLNPGKTLPPG